MDIHKEVKADDVLVGRLAVAFALLNMAPYDNWGHEGDPAEMAAYVVKVSRDRGNLHDVQQAMGIYHHGRTNNYRP